MSGVGSIPNMAIVPPPVGIELMGNQLPPEYIFDQGLSYSAADSYGYLCTGKFQFAGFTCVNIRQLKNFRRAISNLFTLFIQDMNHLVNGATTIVFLG